MVPRVARIEIGQAAVIPIGEVDSAIRAGAQGDWTEPTVIRGHERFLGERFKGRTQRTQRAALDAVAQGDAVDDMVVKAGWKGAAFVNEERLVDMGEPFALRIPHVLEVTEGIRIHERPVLGKIL